MIISWRSCAARLPTVARFAWRAGGAECTTPGGTTPGPLRSACSRECVQSLTAGETSEPAISARLTGRAGVLQATPSPVSPFAPSHSVVPYVLLTGAWSAQLADACTANYTSADCIASVLPAKPRDAVLRREAVGGSTPTATSSCPGLGRRMVRRAPVFKNTGWSCRRCSAGRSCARSTYTTSMGIAQTTDLRILNCGAPRTRRVSECRTRFGGHARCLSGTGRYTPNDSRGCRVGNLRARVTAQPSDAG